MKVFYAILIVQFALLINNCASIISESECNAQEGRTVCNLANQTRACCFVKEATCCPDADYCCPKGFKCDTKNSRCVQGEDGQSSVFIPFHLRVELLLGVGKDILCPDNQTSCKDTQTCCLVDDTTYGCCPIRDAHCCDDKVHCCPKNYKCNPSEGKCDRETDASLVFLPESVEWSVKVPGKKVNDMCPGGSAECPSGSTCCQLESGDWGCCPLPQAVCCQDHVHCCPQGYVCDIQDGRCNKGDISIPFYKKQPAIKVVGVVCPDGSSECPSGSTCCQLSSGGYGCCPLPNATCCSDHIHCCPQGYTCDVKDGRCNKGEISIPFYEKKPAIEAVGVVCPDGSSECPSGSTCCQLSSGSYGCCPLPNATCCSDHVHCCPQGYTCDVKDGRCNKGDMSLPLFNKKPAKKTTAVVCPDGSSQCPSGSTCCQLSSGGYGCCPLPNATCCSDHIHCCPQGYTCDVKDGRCNKGDISIPFYEKKPAIQVVGVVCPDGSSECPSGSTCCQLSSGGYGCCPLPNATCCSDHVHCCPQGYTCDVKDGRCNKNSISIPFYRKFPAIQRPKQSISQEQNEDSKYGSVVCPDGCSFCPNGNTCCKTDDGSYGCCPLPQAVCCPDHLHCCPRNTVCNMEQQTCDGDESSGTVGVSWFEKTPSKMLYDETREDKKLANDPVICADNVTECDPLKTCCKMSDGTYGCCPYSDGICCTELSYCCPGGTTCGQQIGECLPKKNSNWHKIESKATVKKPSVNTCPDSSLKCSDNVPCCKNQNNVYSCCVYENGTCCGVNGLCCPNGYQCNDKDESCQQIDPDRRRPSSSIAPKKLLHSNVKSDRLSASFTDLFKVQCKDTVHYCPDSFTCCKLAANNGQVFGCCPSPDGVCCNDGINCCPNGYKCSTSSSSTVSCIKAN